MPRVLVLALENWLGAASLPRALKSAGFEVSLLCYPNTLISLTRFADDRDLCLPTDPAEVVARRILGLLDAEPVRLMIPGDDRALRFMQHIVAVGGLGRLPAALVELARASLPEPSAIRYGGDKEAASDLMASLGFRTPRRTKVWSIGDLRGFAAEAGLPIVVKPLMGTAGEGVQILRTESELAAARMDAGSPWVAQQYIVGKSAGSASVALDGKCLGTVAFEKTLTYPGETGPASVATRLDIEEIGRGAKAFAKATRFTGFFSPGWMIETETGDPYFIEVNARAVPMVPCASKVGLDLCRCLYARLVGAPVPRQDPDAPDVIAFYPQELHRDPDSPYRHLLLDEPLDDPLVHEAMQAGIAMIASGAV